MEISAIILIIYCTVTIIIVNFLRKKSKAPNINNLRFDNFGWVLIKNETTEKAFKSPELPIQITARVFSENTANQPFDIYEINSVRAYFRKLAVQQNGGLIKVEKQNIKGFETIILITKGSYNQGETYLSAIYIFLKKMTYVIKIQAFQEELGIGKRNGIIMDQLLANGEVFFSDGIQGWYSDPYDKNFSDGNLMNKAEQEKYDKDFPSHALTLVRQTLNKVILSIEIKNYEY